MALVPDDAVARRHIERLSPAFVYFIQSRKLLEKEYDIFKGYIDDGQNAHFAIFELFRRVQEIYALGRIPTYTRKAMLGKTYESHADEPEFEVRMDAHVADDDLATSNWWRKIHYHDLLRRVQHLKRGQMPFHPTKDEEKFMKKIILQRLIKYSRMGAEHSYRGHLSTANAPVAQVTAMRGELVNLRRRRL